MTDTSTSPPTSILRRYINEHHRLRSTLRRLLTPGVGLVISIASLLVGNGLAAARLITHNVGLAMALLGAVMVAVMLVWVFAPEPKRAAKPVISAQGDGGGSEDATALFGEIKGLQVEVDALRSESPGLFTPRFFGTSQA